MDNALISLREAAPSDRSFIFATWLRGLRYGNDYFNLTDKGTFFREYHLILERILTSGVTIKVACLSDDPEVILGYAVYAGPCLHWVFCKAAWRGIGIAKALVPSTITKVTHLTKTGRGILAKHPGVVFDPFNL